MSNAFADRWGVEIKVQDGGADVEGTSLGAADILTDGQTVGPFRYVGLALSFGTVTGTSPTMDISVQVSFDGGTTWYAMPTGANSVTGAATAQFDSTDDVDVFEYWILPSAWGIAGQATQVRLSAAFGGSSVVYPIERMRWVFFDAV